MGKSFVHFSITGEVSLAGIVAELNALELKENQVLTFDVAGNSNNALVNEVIMNLSMFRTVISDVNVFILPQGVNFIVEIANTFKNQLYVDIDYLRFLKTENISSFNYIFTKFSSFEILSSNIFI